MGSLCETHRLRLTRSSPNSLGYLEGFGDGLGWAALVIGIGVVTVSIRVRKFLWLEEHQGCTRTDDEQWQVQMERHMVEMDESHRRAIKDISAA
ncbi:hypothetical protein Scep_001669 [Stephania cephalantha]|uniref:Uncharacterized protein n=1 Tax=Stephania cephalantha TaxID=152367 RepID=A0AAP0Q469_9MAGN